MENFRFIAMQEVVASTSHYLDREEVYLPIQ